MLVGNGQMLVGGGGWNRQMIVGGGGGNGQMLVGNGQMLVGGGVGNGCKCERGKQALLVSRHDDRER